VFSIFKNAFLFVKLKQTNMKKYFTIAALLMISFISFAQIKSTTALSEGATLLFKTTKSKLTNDEKNWLFKQLNFTLSKDKKKFMSDEYEVPVQPYITDMNKDGDEEVFIVMESSALFGNKEQDFILYIKNSKGNFVKDPDLGGGIAMILLSKNSGYPDIAIGGPGFEFPVCRWDGKKYKYLKNIKDADLSKIKYMELSECSKLYTDTLK
jgi:hypothetical protein